MRLWGIYLGGERAVMAETCQHTAVGACKQPKMRTGWRAMGAAVLVLSRGSQGAKSRPTLGPAPALRWLPGWRDTRYRTGIIKPQTQNFCASPALHPDPS